MEMTTPETAMKSSITFSKECLETDPDKDVEESDVGVHICEACGTSFETRKGLSSHARSHLRQLGVSASDSSGAPIDVLYRLMKERGGTLPKLQKQTNPVKKPKAQPSKLKKGTGPKLKIKISNLVKKKYALSSSSTSAVKKSVTKSAKSALLHFVTKKPRKVSSKGLAMSSVSKVRTGQKVAESGLGDASPSTSIPPAPVKPLWAPQETDAPLNLTTMINSSARDDVQVCELCGAWYETRKGLSSHARAHLRQFGVPLDSTCGPIETLHKVIQTEEFKKKTSGRQLEGLSVFEEFASPSSAHSTSVSILKTPSISQNTPVSMRQTPPPNKKLKTSSSDAAADSPISGQTDVKSPTKGELSKNLSCEFCNETFKRSQCLASHARSHLRQLGITEWTVKGSPIATLRKVMAQRGGSLKPLDPSALSPPASPAVPLLSPQSSSSPVPHKVPKARKGSRTVVSKPKDEPVEVDISILQPPKPPSAPTSPLSPPTTLKTSVTPLKLEKQEPAQFVYCEYCGEMFDTRKALSCHARAHLRQLGVKWSEKMPPIEALYELMRREGTERASDVKPEEAEHLKTTASSPNAITPSPVDVTKDKTASDNTTTGLDATCELCGFDFENRKALASHARAHLRQLGVDWKTLGSPIETLRAWMKSEPKKVSDLHKRYLRGDLPFVKKGPRKPRSSDESVRMDSPNGAQVSAGQPQVSPPPKALVGPDPTREMKAGMSHSSSHRKRPASGAPPLIQSPAAHSNLNVRSARGCERRPPKHSSHPEKISEEMEPSKPSRTGNIPSLVPRPPETSLVKLVGKMYSLKCRFCEVVFQGPLSIQEDWVMHLQQHILKLKKNSSSSHQSRDSSEPSLTHTEALPLIGPQAV